MDNTSKNLDEMPKKSPLSFQIDLKKFEKATDDEKKQQDVMSESTSFFKDGMRKTQKKPAGYGKYRGIGSDHGYDLYRTAHCTIFLFSDHYRKRKKR